MNTSKEELKENLAYLIVWLLLLLTPIISMGVRMIDDSQLTFRWEAIIREWRVILPFLIVFVVHNYMIAPLLIYKKKKWLYVALTLCVLAVMFNVFKYKFILSTIQIPVNKLFLRFFLILFSKNLGKFKLKCRKKSFVKNLFYFCYKTHFFKTPF